MLETTAILQYQSELFECRKLSMRTANNFFLGGWVAKDRAEEFQKLLESLDGVTCISESPEDNGALPTPPTQLKNRWFFRPFETFVKMYGLPRYGEIDPTPLVALTYCILFGLMFGDVGQGAVIAAIGFIMYRVKRADFGKILASIGLFSVAGGFLYGSVFGYEVLPGLHPLEDSNLFNLMMFASIGFGVVLIIVTMAINIINSVRRKNFTEGLFGNNGVAGVLFYLAIVVGVLGMFGFGQSVFTVPYIIVFVVLPLLAMFLKEPLGKLVKRQKDIVPKKKGEFILENFFELFDVLLSYITNTISFVRIQQRIVGNIGVFAIFAIILTVFVFSGNAAAAGEVAAEAGNSGLANGLGYLAAALSTGMSTIGAGIAVAAGASAAIGATSEDPKMLSKGLIFVALGEGIVLYGLLMSFMILNQLG